MIVIAIVAAPFHAIERCFMRSLARGGDGFLAGFADSLRN